MTPIRSVDKIQIGAGRRGEVTARVQKVFFEITSGEREAPGPWLTYVNEARAVPAENNGHGASPVTGAGVETETKVSESFLAVGTE